MPRNSQLVLLTTAFLVLVIVLGFSGGLYISFFKNHYVNSVVSSYSVAGGQAVRKIEYAIKYGKSLENFYGIDKILREIQADFPAVENVRVVLPNGMLAYDSGGVVAEEALEPKLVRYADFQMAEANEKFKFSLHNGKYHVFLPIRDKGNGWLGTLDILFDEEVINKPAKEYVNTTVQTMVFIAVLAFLCLLLAIYAIPLFTPTGNFRIKRILALLLIILGLSQGAFGFYHLFSFQAAYVATAKNNTLSVGRIIQKTIDEVTGKGISYSELYHIEDWLNKIIEVVPEIGVIQIKTVSGEVLHRAAGETSGDPAGVPAVARQEYTYDFVLGEKTAGARYVLEVGLSERHLSYKIREMALDAITVLLISLLFMVEVTLFVTGLLRRKIITGRLPDLPGGGTADFSIIRPLAFAFFGSWAMSLTFIPVMMRDFYQPFLGLSPGIIYGLPVSLEAFMSIVSTVLTGYIMDKRGWKPPFVFGLAIAVIGTLLSALAVNAGTFILARSITGIGYGFSWMSIRGFAAAVPTPAGKSETFAGLNAGIYAGINCGVVLGAMLAEQIGFSRVFLLSAAALLLITILAYYFAENVTAVKPIVEKDAANQTNVTAGGDREQNSGIGKRLWNFCQDYDVAAFFLLVAIPSSVCLMFLSYFFPVFGKSIQISAADIGRGFLLYGLCLVYLGPLFANFLGRSRLKKAMVLANFLCILGLVIFAVYGSYHAAMAAIFLLGLAHSIGLVAQNNYLLTLPAVDQMGTGMALGVYSVVSKVGQVIGPLIFGGVMVLGMDRGVGLIGLLFLILLAAFLFITRSEGKRKPDELENGV